MTSKSDYKKFWEKHFKQEERDKKSLLEFLRRSADTASKILVEQYKAKKVYLFGSALNGSFFHKHSDVDLAVEGLKPQKYFSALAKIADVFEGRSRVDLLPLEDASPKIKERVQKEGKLLYG